MGQFDSNRRGSGCRIIVLFEPSANLSCLHPNDRVVGCRIVRLAAKYLDTDHSLFKKFVAAFQLMLNHIGEELLASRTVPEGMAVKDIAEFPQDRRFLGVAECGDSVRTCNERFRNRSHGPYLPVLPRPPHLVSRVEAAL